MTTPDLIAFLRAKLTDSFWDFHGPSIVQEVARFEASVRDEGRFETRGNPGTVVGVSENLRIEEL